MVNASFVTNQKHNTNTRSSHAIVWKKMVCFSLLFVSTHLTIFKCRVRLCSFFGVVEVLSPSVRCRLARLPECESSQTVFFSGGILVYPLEIYHHRRFVDYIWSQHEISLTLSYAPKIVTSHTPGHFASPRSLFRLWRCFLLKV